MKSPSIAPGTQQKHTSQHVGARKPTRDRADRCRDKRRQTTGLQRRRSSPYVPTFLSNAAYDACPNLRTELLGYMSDDEYCVTDSVMSLAVALDQAGSIPPPGHVIAVIQA